MEMDSLEVEGTQSEDLDRRSLQHTCNFCTDSFTSELGLILHFRGEHYFNREGEEVDDQFLSDESANEVDEADEGEPEGEGTEAGGELDFITDYERALLAAEPAFDPYPELEEEEEDDELEEVDSEPPADAEISWDVVVGPEHEDYDFWRGLPSSEKNRGEASHEEAELPNQTPSPDPSSRLPKKEAYPAKEKLRPSKRILPGRTYKVISTTSTPGGRPQFRLSLLPPEKGKKVAKAKKDEDKVKSNVITDSAKTKPPVPIKSRQGRPPKYGRGHQFDCIFCGKTYLREFEFHGHLRSHIMERPYCCKLCDQSFAQTNYLTQHIRKCHAGATPYKCKLCPESFSTRGRLTNHHFALHKEQMKLGQPKPIFRCEACNRTFSFLTSKNRHMRTFHSAIQSPFPPGPG